LICLATITAVFAYPYRVPAQYKDWMGGNFNNPFSAQMSTRIWTRVFYRVPETLKLGGGKSAASSSGAPSQPAPNKTVDESSLRFRSSGTRLKTHSFADQLGNTPAERDQYLKLMNAVLDGFDQRVKAAGLQNDLAIALSYFLAENVRIYQGEAELSDQQYIDIRNVIAEALVTSGALSHVTDGQKQEFYEALVAYTGITQFGYEQAKQAGDDTMAKGYQRVAGQNLQTVTKMPPDSLKLSSHSK